jgi:hypothetical protein
VRDKQKKTNKYRADQSFGALPGKKSHKQVGQGLLRVLAKAVPSLLFFHAPKVTFIPTLFVASEPTAQ